MRIVHISDLHYGYIDYNPLQLFSKRIIGNCNFIFKRRFLFQPHLIHSFGEYLATLNADAVIISGDFTTTSLGKEFKEAKKFLETLREKHLVFAIPGNHDLYTKRAKASRHFYRYLGPLFPLEGEFGLNLEKDKIAAFKLFEGRFLILLDCSDYMGYLLSTGHFTDALQEKLKALLSKLGKNDKAILCCHYPFFQHQHKKHCLIGAKKMQDLLQDEPKVDLYLHGHTHRHTLAHLRGNGLPMICDSGSISNTKGASFNVIDLEPYSLKITPYTFKKSWEKGNEYVV